jgi:hypothetical protein
LKADLEFTKQIDAETIKGYHSWAYSIVEFMKNNPDSIITQGTKWIAQHRTNEIKYQLGLTDKPDYIGKYIRLFGETFCWGLGTLINNLNMDINDDISKNNAQFEQNLDETLARLYKGTM